MFVVFNADTTIEKKRYERYSDAKRLADKLNAKEASYDKKYRDHYEAYNVDFYYEYVVHQHTVRNLMSGKPVQERSNTPWSCSVASETYWSS